VINNHWLPDVLDKSIQTTDLVDNWLLRWVFQQFLFRVVMSNEPGDFAEELIEILAA
jgi:hypothetical protein